MEGRRERGRGDGGESIKRHRTFSNFILTEIARYIDFFHMSSGWFNCTEPSPTTSLQGIQGVQGAIWSSGWFDCTEPSLTTSLQGKQGVQGAYALVRGGSRASNLFKPHHRRDNKKCTGNRLNFACGANSSITEITRASFF